jgi:hypothetical protein
METEDLTQLKHIGAARMKLLNNAGITTIKALYEIPLEKLAQLETIGNHYARLIKAAVMEVYRPSPETTATEIVSDQEQKIGQSNQDLQKQIKLLKVHLKQTGEKLKPLGKKKYLELYVDVKKRSKTLKTRLKSLEQFKGDLPEKAKKKIIKKADVLNAALQNVGKKPRKKTYKALSQKIRSFSKMIRDANPTP